MNSIKIFKAVRELLAGSSNYYSGNKKHLSHHIILYSLLIILSGGLYAAAVGLWRSPLQAFYAFIKFPLLIFLTVLGTAVINWLMSRVLGLAMSIMESLRLILMSFAIASLILLALTPAALFFIINFPETGSAGEHLSHSGITLMNVALIALAGVSANFRLYQSLAGKGDKKIAGRILSAWLAVDLFLGAQLSWNLRPFIGSPDIRVEFFSPEPFKGNFYESVYNNIMNLIKQKKQEE